MKSIAETWPHNPVLDQVETLDMGMENAQKFGHVHDRSIQETTDILMGKTYRIDYSTSASLEQRETLYKPIIRIAQMKARDSFSFYQPLQSEVKSSLYWGHFMAILVIDAAAKVLNRADKKAELPWQYIYDSGFRGQVINYLCSETMDAYGRHDYFHPQLNRYTEDINAIGLLLTPAFIEWYQSVRDRDSKRDMSALGQQRRRRAEFLQIMRQTGDVAAHKFLSSPEVSAHNDPWIQNRLALLTIGLEANRTGIGGSSDVHKLDAFTGRYLPQVLAIGDLLGHKMMNFTIDEIEVGTRKIAEAHNSSLADGKIYSEKAGVSAYNLDHIQGTFSKYRGHKVSAAQAQQYNALFSRCWQLSQASFDQQGMFCSLIQDNISTQGGCLAGILNRLMLNYINFLYPLFDEIFWDRFDVFAGVVLHPRMEVKPDKEVKGAALEGVSVETVETLQEARIYQAVVLRGVENILTASGATDAVIQIDYRVVDPKNKNVRALMAGYETVGRMLDVVSNGETRKHYSRVYSGLYDRILAFK